MIYNKIDYEDLGAWVEVSAFTPDCAMQEWHTIVHVAPQGEGFAGQCARLREAVKRLCNVGQMHGAQFVFKRYFLSDATNQQHAIGDTSPCTISYIQQPPLDGSKIALWAYLVRGAEVEYNADALGSTVVRHNGLEHIWTMNMTESKGDSYYQTQQLLLRYEDMLAQRGTTIEANCIRTWFFVRDIDTHYKGLVVARRENFDLNGLRSDTHYISSTGIGGSPADTKALVQLGAYAIKGLTAGQQRYLYAPTHLNRTSDYGVTFERGTAVEHADRRHVFISGTASIDNKGAVVHVGNVAEQTKRMWENVEALLAEADTTFADVMQIIVYLRDIADYSTIAAMFHERFPDIPTIITLAPVCRPEWLIEMECIAVVKI